MDTGRGSIVFTVAIVLLLVGCVDTQDEAPAGQDWFGPPAATIQVYGPAEAHAYQPTVYLASVTAADGKLVSGAGMTMFEYEEENDPAAGEVMVATHEIGSSGVYAVGKAGDLDSHGLALTTPGPYHIHCHAMHQGEMFKGATEVDVEADHADVEDTTSSNEYEVLFWLEEVGAVPTGHVHEGDALDVVFQVSDEDTGSPVTTLSPLIYVAERGGTKAVAGITFASVAADAQG